MAAVSEVVATSSRVRMRLLRQRIVPVLVWAVAIVAALVLYQRQAHHVDAVGLVQKNEVVVAPVNNGTVQVVQVSLLDEVSPGQIVALMDDGAVEAELKAAEVEMTRLLVELNAVRAVLGQAATQRQRLLVDREEAQLNLIRLRIHHEVNLLLLERTEQVRDRQQAMVQSGALDEMTYQEILKRYEALQLEIGETEAMIQVSRDRARSLTDQAAGARRPDEELSGLLLPLQQALAAQQARILEVQTRRATRVLRSSVAGTVTQIFHRAGDTVSAGTPLLMISNKEVTTIIAFVDEGAASRIENGAEAQVYPRTVPGTTLLARVARIGTSMVERPVQVRKNQGTLEWGVPILLTQMSEQALLPGQVVDLRLATN